MAMMVGMGIINSSSERDGQDRVRMQARSRKLKAVGTS